MTRVYSKLPDGFNGLYVWENEAYFGLYTEPKWESLPEEKHMILRDVDFSTIKIGKIVESKFGLARLLDISTGAKTCLNVLLLREQDAYVDLLECGDNAIACAVRLADGYPIKLIGSHYDGDMAGPIYYNDVALELPIRIYGGKPLC